MKSESVGLLLLLALASLHACKSPGGQKFLSVVFDGVPAPSEAQAKDSVSLPHQPVAMLPSEVELPDPNSVGTESVTPTDGLLPSVVPKDPSLADWESIEETSPIEKATTFEKVLELMPLDDAGGADWVQAMANGLVTPRLLDNTTPSENLPFTLDTLAKLGGLNPEKPLLDLDLLLVPESNPFFEVRFPHAPHTQLLNCSSCHPNASSMEVEMDRILAGEACGQCHGRVSFEPQISCGRCHPNLLFPSEAEVEEDLSRVRREPVGTGSGALVNAADLYERYCSFCHGDSGDGKGRFEPWLDTKPRDFTAGTYKFRSTIGTLLPTDADLFRTITRGVPGTSMPPWRTLSYEDRWALVDYIKTFSRRFATEEAGQPLIISAPPEITSEILVSGLDLYKQAGCSSCHGDNGDGNGPSAATLEDDWGQPSRPFNLTSGRPLKSGSSLKDLYRIVMAGLPGTPMPGFGQVLQPQMAWALAAYVDSLRGTAPNPFAVRGDIAFERPDIPPEPAIAEIAAIDLDSVAAAELAAQDELFLLAGKDTPPSVFPHWFHRIRFKCSSCHPAIFEMKAGSNPITMTALRRGEFCASCHNGTIAFEVGFTTCVRCHQVQE